MLAITIHKIIQSNVISSNSYDDTLISRAMYVDRNRNDGWWPSFEIGNSIQSNNSITRTSNHRLLESTANAKLSGYFFSDYGSRVKLSGDGNIAFISTSVYNEEERGMVFSYELRNNMWIFRGKLPTSYKMLGLQIDCSTDGNTMIAGTWEKPHLIVYDWIDNAFEVRSGTHYTFFEGYSMGEGQGLSVSMNGNGNRIATNIYIYDWDNVSQTWKVNTGVTNITDLPVRYTRLSKDGNKIALSSVTYETEGSHGAVDVFYYDGLSWSQQGSRLTASHAQEYFGDRMDFSNDGTVMCVGAYGLGIIGYATSPRAFGSVVVYEYNDSHWNQKGQRLFGDVSSNTPVENVYTIGQRACSLSGDGTIVVIGNEGDTNTNGQWAGNVRIYKWNALLLTWIQDGNDLNGLIANERHGTTVDISEDAHTIISGSYPNNENSLARIYTTLLPRPFSPSAPPPPPF